MEKLTLQEYLQLPELNLSEMGKFFRGKKWLIAGGTNAYRKNHREWVYDGDEKYFFEFRDSKKNGKTWTYIILEKYGEFERLFEEILTEGFELNEQNKDPLSRNWYSENNFFELHLKKFADMAGKEVFHLILKNKNCS